MRRPISAAWVLPAALGVLLSTTSCAVFHHRPPEPATAGVPIEKRPTPVQPDTTLAVETKPVPAPVTPPPEAEKPAPAPQPAPPTPTPPVETAMSPEERKASLQRIVADTTAASSAASKCAGKDLLPDQQSVYETTRSLLSQTRVAIVREELWRAESLARKARQLALSLECH